MHVFLGAYTASSTIMVHEYRGPNNCIIVDGCYCNIQASGVVMLRCNNLTCKKPNKLFIDNKEIKNDILRRELIRFYQGKNLKKRRRYIM